MPLLVDPKVLEAQVHRMLMDPRSESLVTNFAFQWLNVGHIDNIQPDPVLYPDFDPALRAGFREEIRLFLGNVMRENHSVLDLLRSDTTFVNIQGRNALSSPTAPVTCTLMVAIDVRLVRVRQSAP